ncbi:MAG TPA: hypothetical protein VGI39_42720 [Polyangiaceae bacterium]|jgi:hypothetical protein
MGMARAVFVAVAGALGAASACAESRYPVAAAPQGSAGGALGAPAPIQSSAPEATAANRTLCEARCARDRRCDPATPEPPSCACGALEPAGVIRADWAAAAIDCFARPGCDPPDECERSAFRAIGQSPLDWPPIVLRCLSRGDECGGSSATCRRLAALTEGARAAAAPCFDEPCAVYSRCFAAFVSTRMTPAVPEWR